MVKMLLALLNTEDSVLITAANNAATINPLNPATTTSQPVNLDTERLNRLCEQGALCEL